MLERATACLKSGAARDTLRCVHLASRSKRMLHSTFWSHGAGDLDLPPWAVSMFPLPSDLPLKHDNTATSWRLKESRDQLDVRGTANVSSEGLLLDFLYPPKALALLRRANSQQWQRWEKRNARRLPEGFIVASRGYASRPHVVDTFVETSVADGKQKEEVDAGDEEEGYSYADGVLDDSKPGPDTRTTQSSSSQSEAESGSAFAASPADLAEQVISSTHAFGSSPTEPADGVYLMRRLRNIMLSSRSGHAKKSKELTETAIAIYDSLDEDNKKDVRLQRELVEWLSLQKNETAESRCIELYRRIPRREKTLQTYQAALSIFLKRKLFQPASRLHREALQTIENGHQVTRLLFTHAVEHQEWLLAIQTYRCHWTRYASSQEANQVRLFWLHVSETPQLLLKAIQLAKFLRLPSEDKDTHGYIDRQFCAEFFKEAVSQEFLREGGPQSLRYYGLTATPPRRQIRRLFDHLSRVEQGTRQLFENTLLSMLEPSSRTDYGKLHHVVSFVYAKYRRLLDGKAPPLLLFTSWLERLIEYASKLASLNSTTHSASVNDVVREWRRYYKHVNKEAVHSLLVYYAKRGHAKIYKQWLRYLRSTYPSYQDQKDILWTRVCIHARRANLDMAQYAFAKVKRIAAENGEEPEIKCWNMLLHAHSRADDLEGGLTNLQNLIDYSKLTPDEYSFHNISQMLAKRGDVDGTQDLLQQYDRITAKPRSTALAGSIMLAHINSGDVQTAETILKETTANVRSGKVRGSLTGCFNLVMTAHAMRRDMTATTRTYRWMKLEKIFMNGNSYAAFMQALVFFRQTQRAQGILKYVMPANNIEPTGFHYAIAIAGFVNNRQPGKAIRMYEKMVEMNIRPTVSAHSTYLKARAIIERFRIKHSRRFSREPIVLKETVKDLTKLLNTRDEADITLKQPNLGLNVGTIGLAEADPAAYFDFLIFVHGQQRCFDAVRELFHQYRESLSERNRAQETTPIKLLSSLMAAHFRAGEFGDVEKYWRLAKEQADEIAAPVTVPRLKSLQNKTELEEDALELDPMTTRSKVKSDIGPSTESASWKEAPTQDASSSTESKQTLLLDKQVLQPPSPVPARRHILTRVLRYYLLSLHGQGRTVDAIKTVTQYLRQGYTMDNSTWNTFIESLCRLSPPLALLAYVLTERFLIPYFPGWSSTPAYPPGPEDHAEGLQYIEAQHLRPGQLMPRYRSLVWLGGALLELRKMEALGRSGFSHAMSPELQKYVGTLRQIRKLAPKTLFAVQSMPKVDDRIQSQVLRREDS